MRCRSALPAFQLSENTVGEIISPSPLTVRVLVRNVSVLRNWSVHRTLPAAVPARSSGAGGFQRRFLQGLSFPEAPSDRPLFAFQQQTFIANIHRHDCGTGSRSFRRRPAKPRPLRTGFPTDIRTTLWLSPDHGVAEASWLEGRQGPRSKHPVLWTHTLLLRFRYAPLRGADCWPQSSCGPSRLFGVPHRMIHMESKPRPRVSRRDLIHCKSRLLRRKHGKARSHQ